MASCRTIIYLCVYSIIMANMATCMIGMMGNVSTIKSQCDIMKCAAPIAHYMSLNCKPMYNKLSENNCCAWRYNCDHLYDKIQKKNDVCHFNGNEYAIGEKISNFHLCEEDCICEKGKYIADFKCTKRNCSNYNHSRDGCYKENTVKQCCQTEEICPDDLETKHLTPICNSGGLKYASGDYVLQHFNEKICVCEGSLGVSNFFSSCNDLKRLLDVHAAAAFYRNCAPVYVHYGKMETGIRIKTFRCQEPNDTIIHNSFAEDEHGPLPMLYCPPCGSHQMKKSSDPCRFINPEGPMSIIRYPTYRVKCRLGQLTMHVGDSVTNMTYKDSCIICTCKIPPVPTCLLMPGPCP